MQAWTVNECDAAGEQAASAAVVGAVGAIGAADFADAALGALNQALSAASWSVYRLWSDRAPRLHLSASLGVPDTTQRCFAAYQDGLYRRDRSFDRVRGMQRPGHAAVLHMRADEAPSAEHRDIIYRRHGLLERISVATLEADGSLLAVNLYHHEHQGRFSGIELEGFSRLGGVLLAVVRRHLALTETSPGGAQTDPRARLESRCPALTPRELDVCERLLRGWTHDGIAADLGLSVATVKTYRARAFERLGLHFRSELFAQFGGRAG